MIQKKLGFTLIELLISIVIIGILANIGLNTFTSAQVKSRDAKRKAHLKQLADAFEAYFNDNKRYPESNEAGQIMACGPGYNDSCAWGQSSFQSPEGAVYMIKLPADPTQGLNYHYASLNHGAKFQLYSYLENNQDPSIMALTGPNCGAKTCNYGVSSSNILPQTGRE